MSNLMDKDKLYRAAMAAAAATGSYTILDPEGLKYFRKKLDDRYIAASEKGKANGVATLDANGKLTASQTPLGLDDYIEVDTLPTTGQDATTFYYVKTGGDTTDTITKGKAGHTYRWVTATSEETTGHYADITAADVANKALADDQGNTISTTYATKKELTDGLGKKVDAINGKGLSTNDYTNEEKQKLATLKNYVLPIAGDSLGGVKNGGNVVIRADGTANVTFPEAPAITAMTHAEIDAAFVD